MYCPICNDEDVETYPGGFICLGCMSLWHVVDDEIVIDYEADVQDSQSVIRQLAALDRRYSGIPNSISTFWVGE